MTHSYFTFICDLDQTNLFLVVQRSIQLCLQFFLLWSFPEQRQRLFELSTGQPYLETPENGIITWWPEIYGYSLAEFRLIYLSWFQSIIKSEASNVRMCADSFNTGEFPNFCYFNWRNGLCIKRFHRKIHWNVRKMNKIRYKFENIQPYTCSLLTAMICFNSRLQFPNFCNKPSVVTMETRLILTIISRIFTPL